MQMRMVLGVSVATLVGCSSGPAQGEEGGACFPNGTCNAGLTCLSQVCVNAAADSGADSGVDSGADVTASDAAGDADDAGPWSPAQLGTSLALWLDDTVGLTKQGSNVSAWSDQSTNHNDVTATAGDAGQLPTLTANAQNAHDAVTFPGVSGVELLKASPTGIPLSGDFAIDVVARLNTSFSGGNLVSHGVSTTGWTLVFNFSGALFHSFIDGTEILSPSGSYLDSKFHIVEVRRVSGQITASVDAATSAPTSYTKDFSAQAAIHVGGDPTYPAPLAGDIAEVVVVNGTLSDPDRTKLVAYFKAKFAL